MVKSGFPKKEKKLIDIGFRLWLSLDLEITFRTVSKDIGRFEGLHLPSINLKQKYIHTRLCTRAIVRSLITTVFTVRIGKFLLQHENLRGSGPEFTIASFFLPLWLVLAVRVKMSQPRV